ncbi:hypothetical protein CHH28_08935 [Bacterioplanes sanyensis]|uniref:DUF4386 domain-containing protein n=1 Tax=Bacterioplanes sanyensis TaxID=1249553 RepID=A0A222FR47_9GAMM|nr:hypothetical protein [Bacterioplanes sanyensis]ASP40871.1 hypothetical protein CHH28_08935 [Bacterioplanes sanyensis]
MKKIDYIAGYSGIALALIYIAAFVYFGAFWAYPHSAGEAERLAYLADNQVVISSVYYLIYAIFGVVLSGLVLGLHEKYADSKAAFMSKFATLFGALWIGLVIATAMIFVTGLNSVVSLAPTNTERATETWHIVALLTESLGGGNELVGGLWVLLVSLCNLSAKLFSRGLNYLGVFVGLAGIATVYPADVITEIFGITQIVWFAWIGVGFIRLETSQQPEATVAHSV